MIYICENCKYLFSSDKELDQCPDCGKYAVYTASESEVEEYHRIQMKNKHDHWEHCSPEQVYSR